MLYVVIWSNDIRSRRIAPKIRSFTLKAYISDLVHADTLSFNVTRWKNSQNA